MRLFDDRGMSLIGLIGMLVVVIGGAVVVFSGGGLEAITANRGTSEPPTFPDRTTTTLFDSEDEAAASDSVTPTEDPTLPTTAPPETGGGESTTTTEPSTATTVPETTSTTEGPATTTTTTVASTTTTTVALATGCTVLIPASERSVTDMTQERICFEPRTEAVRIRDVTASVLDFAGAGTITLSGIDIRDSSNLTLQNVTIDTTNAGKSVIGIQAWSIPDLSVIGCDMTGVYIGIHHENSQYLGPNDSLGTMTVKNCIIRNAIHEGLYIGQSGRSFDESTMPAFAMVRITNNTIRNSGWDCMQFSSSRAVEVIGNVCDGFGRTPENGDPSRQTAGIVVMEQTAGAKCALVKGNTIDATKNGYDGVLVVTTACADIRDNRIIRSGNRGVTVFSGGRAIITGNVFDRLVAECWGGGGDIEASGNECLE